MDCLHTGPAAASGWSLEARVFQPLARVPVCRKGWWREGWGLGQILDSQQVLPWEPTLCD